MNKFSTKLVSLAISGMTIVSFSGTLLPAYAQSTDLAAQIAALLAQVNQLQAQLAAKDGTSSMSFTHNLTVGSKGNEVTALQNVLASKGYLKAAARGYFGSLTKAAVVAWQIAAGISPASGYFGPKSRAAFAAMAGPATPPPAPAPAPAPGSPPGTPAPNAPASGMSVALASDNPASGSLIPSSSRNKVFNATFTAGVAGPVTISSIKFRKVGVLSDSSIAGAYITEGGRVLSQYNSISGGFVNFAGLSLTVGAGQSRTFGLQIDPAAGLNAGNTVSFSLNSAADIVSFDASNAAVNETGSFPIAGNIFTVTTVTNPSLATLTITSSSIGTNVTAGTTNALVGAWNFTVGNSKVNLSSIKFQSIGSATMTDLKNVKLLINGTQVGQTLASVGANREAFIDVSANPGVFNTGSNNVQIYADIMGSPSYNFQLEILNSYDVYALDSQYNVPVLAAANVGTQVTIVAGTITVSQAASTPTGNVAAGQSGITLAKFTVYAAGEAVKIKWLGVGLNLTGASGTIDTLFKNLALTDDAGGQVGTTINTLSTSVTCTDTAFNSTFSSTTTLTYVNCYGNSASPINYIVPANTTRVFSLKADVQSAVSGTGTTFSTVVGRLVGNTSNLQGLTSSQTASSAGANGSALSLASSNLTVARNSAIGTQNVPANTTGKKIGSYAFTASTAEGVTVSSLSITANGGSWSNLLVKVGSAQFGSTQGTVASGTTYSFSGSPFTVPIGGTTYVEVFADALSSASGNASPATVLSGCSASGAVSLTAISCTSTNGQNITFAGQSSITVSLDSGSPATAQLVMGSFQSATVNNMAIFRFTETSNVEDVKITNLNVFDTVAASTTKSGFGSVSLYNSAGTLLGTAGSAITSIVTSTNNSSSGPGYYYTFNFATPVVVPQANSVSLTLKGDVSSYASSGATDNTTHVFKITNSSDTALATNALVVVALGSTSNATSVVTLSSPNANAHTILRSRLLVTATAAGTATGRSKQTVDDLGYINFAADAAGAVQIGSVAITYSGSAPSGSNFFNSAAGLITIFDTNGNVTYNPVTTSTTKLTYDLANYQLSGGSSKSFTVRINSTVPQTAAGTSGVSQTLAATVSASTDVTWQDALPNQGATGGLSLQSSTVPIPINAVSYAQGT